ARPLGPFSSAALSIRPPGMVREVLIFSMNLYRRIAPPLLTSVFLRFPSDRRSDRGRLHCSVSLRANKWLWCGLGMTGSHTSSRLEHRAVNFPSSPLIECSNLGWWAGRGSNPAASLINRKLLILINAKNAQIVPSPDLRYTLGTQATNLL